LASSTAQKLVDCGAFAMSKEEGDEMTAVAAAMLEVFSLQLSPSAHCSLALDACLDYFAQLSQLL